MKLAYLTNYDPANVAHWSGLGAYIFKAIRSQGIEAVSVRATNSPRLFHSYVKRVICKVIMKKSYHRDRDKRVIEGYSKILNTKMQSEVYDVALCPGTTFVSFLKTNVPIIIWTDATFAGVLNFYPEYSNLCSQTIRHGNELEQRALDVCTIAAFSSEWAAETAIKHYRVDNNKIRVIPYGANVECNRSITEIMQYIHKREGETCRLLFAGVNWERKGGPVAVNVLRELKKRGTRAELHVLGCNVPDKYMEDDIVQHGFISKATEDGRKRIDEIFSSSHYLILPSIAECCAMVFAEANSFGVPALSTNVGGNATAIKSLRNGLLVDLENQVDNYCDFIISGMKSSENYKKLAINSFNEYMSSLNWDLAGRRMKDVIDEVLL